MLTLCACLVVHPFLLVGRAGGLVSPNRREVLASSLLVSFGRPPPLVFDRPLAKGALDTRDYRLVTLANGLKCLLVSGCDTCGAALEVSAGSFADPSDLAGLGHLTEHALFLGTRKDSREDGFERIAASSGGSANAFTQGESTRYFFDGPEEALTVMFPPWSQFFSAPLLDEGRVRREIGAVDAEHAKNLRNDAFRIDYLDSVLRQPAPYSNFATGNRQTLDKPRLMSAMREYVDSRYVAGDMACVVAGKQSLDELQALVSSSGLKDVKQQQQSAASVRPASDEIGHRFFLNPEAASSALLVESLNSQRALRVAWSLAYDEEEGMRPGAMRAWSDRIAAHVLGHEGPNSLLADLKSADFATDLSAGMSESNEDYRVFEIDVELTKRGLSSWRQVAGRCAAFVAALGAASGRRAWPRHVVEEPRKISEVAFEWSEPLPASTLSNVLVGKLRELGREAFVDDKLLKIGAVPIVRDDDELEASAQRYAMRLAATKPTVSVIGATASGLRTIEPVYGTRYDVVDFAFAPSGGMPEKIFPDPNPYAPSSSTYFPNKVPGPADSPPQRLFDTFWHAAENRGTPRASCLVLARMPPPSTPRDAATAKLWRSLLVETLRDSSAQDYVGDGAFRSYDAALAGYGWELAQTQRGIVVSFAGYDDKLGPFVAAGLDAIYSSGRVDGAPPPLFSRVKDALERDLDSASTNISPISRAISQLTRLLEPNKFDPKDLLAALKPLTQADAARYYPFASTTRLDALFAGNLDSSKATELAKTIAIKSASSSSGFQDSSAHHPSLRLCPACGDADKLVPIVVSTSSGPDETNIASVVHFQTGGGRRARVLSAVAGTVLEPRFYESLRTKQQLGYLVQASARNKEGLAGLVFLVQSGTKSLSPRDLTEKIEEFVSQELPVVLDNLSQKEFADVKKGLANNLLAKSPSLGSLASTFWDEIVAETTDWSRRKKDAALLSTITIDELKLFVQKATLGPNRRSIAFEVARSDAGGRDSEDGRTIVKDLRAFADTLPRAPTLLELENVGDDLYVDFA